MLLAILEEKKLCRLYKYLGIDRFEDHDTARAKSCKYFILNVEEMNKMLKGNSREQDLFNN